MSQTPASQTTARYRIFQGVVTAVTANVLLALRSKRMPGFETMLTFGLEKALLRVAGIALTPYITPTNVFFRSVNPLDIEYLSSAFLASLTAWWKSNPSGIASTSASYLAMEQVLINSISHLIE